MKRKVLVLADAPMVSTGFAQVTRNLLKELYDTGNYEIDMVGINYNGVFNKQEFEDRYYYLNRIVPAKQPNSMDMMGREYFTHVLLGKRPELKPPWDIVFTIQDHFILEAKSSNTGNKFSHTLKDIQRQILENDDLRNNYFTWIAYWPVDSVLKKIWVDDAIAQSDFPVAYCNYGYDEIMKLDSPENKLNDRLKIVRHGTNTTDFKPLKNKRELRKKYFKDLIDDETFLIINVNRNQIRKDLARTLMIYKEFRKQVPNSFLYLHCNPKDVGGNIYDIGQSVGLDGGEFGYPRAFDPQNGIPIEQVNELYNCADAVMTTTLGEGWGLSITEAMATKTPIVAPNITSVPELLNTAEGFNPDISRGFPIKAGSTASEWVCLGADDFERVRPLTNVEDGVAQLLYIKNNPDIVKQVTERAYNWAKELTWASENDKWVKIFDEACKVNDILRETGGVYPKVGRNEPCPCNSGKKYKKCHGST